MIDVFIHYTQTHTLIYIHIEKQEVNYICERDQREREVKKNGGLEEFDASFRDGVSVEFRIVGGESDDRRRNNGCCLPRRG